MRKFTIATFALLLSFGVLISFRVAQSTSEQNRLAEIERRDKWINDTISQVAAGQSSVSLYSCTNTNLMLEKLAGMEQIESVSFQQTIDLTDDGLQFLAELPNLNQLEFSGESISNDSMQILAQCKNLRLLSLQLTGVTDAGLDTISQMPQLEAFHHYGQFSPEAMKSLSEKIPGLKIIDRAERQ